MINEKRFFGEKPPIPEEKEKGRNVTMIIKLGRHAEKEPGDVYGQISMKGKETARLYGEHLFQEVGEVFGLKAYASKQPRAVETRDIITGAADERFIKLRSQKREELDYKSIKSLPEGGWGKYQKGFLKEKYPEFDRLSEEEKYKARQEAEDYMCNLAIKNNEYIEDAASRIAHLLDTQTRIADRLRSNSRAVLVDISHNTPIMCFLKKCLVRENINTGLIKQGFDDVNEIGGSFKPMEFFELKTEIDNQGNKEYSFKFSDPNRLKNFKCSLDLKELKRLSNRYIETEVR